MHGIGNDFVLLDARVVTFVKPAELARTICDRRYGVGADGLIFVERSELASVRMRMLNPDGTESEMCGNGLRCVARFAHPSPGAISVETGGRVTECEVLEDERVRVQMGAAQVIDAGLEVQGWRGVLVEIGNPHYVVFVPEVASIALESVGPKLETDSAFINRANIHFAEVLGANQVRQRTWERGAGVTLACGSGACAGAVAAVHLGLAESPVRMQLPGGDLDIEVCADGSVVMTGACETAFSGIWLV